MTPALYHRQLGLTGPVIAFLPGLGLTTRYWEPRIEPLAASHRLLLVDVLGFGRSPKPWTTYSVERHVESLHAVLRDQGPLTVVGHSVGALLAVAYAARHPRNVDRLVLVGLPYFHGETESRQFLRGRSTLDRWVLTNTVFAAVACVLTRHVMRRLLPRLLGELPREVVEDYVQHTWRSATSTVREVVYRYDVCVDAERLAPHIRVLLLHGGRDGTAPIAAVRQLAGRHGTWRLAELPEGDHNLLLNDPAWFRSQIARFVEVPGRVTFTCATLRDGRLTPVTSIPGRRGQ